jgi:hypothetical protein
VSIRRLQARLARDESGLGITEVIAAVVILAIITIGMAYSMVTMTKLTYEATNRETAANLAAAEIDRINTVADVFNLHSSVTSSDPIDGIVYKITTSVAWVNTNGASGTCGGLGGNLQYKSVNVTVTWPQMLHGGGVHADTVMAPQSRINDPSYGTILVSVLGVDGKPSSSVTVKVTPMTGDPDAKPITKTIPVTDIDGCSFVLKVSPGKYDVQIEKTAYIGTNQALKPVIQALQVSAGATATAGFDYDVASTFTLKYAANSNKTPALPSNLDTTYLGGLAPYTANTPASPIKLYFPATGYDAIAGLTSGTQGDLTCKSTDPLNWAEDTTFYAGVRPFPVGSTLGGSGTLNIPMGVFTVKMPAQAYVTAVQQSTGPAGDPGCANPVTYSWATRYNSGVTQSFALPYGTWKLYYGSSAPSVTNQLKTNITVNDGVVQLDANGVMVKGILGNSKVAGNVITFDPRQPK